MKRNRRHFTGIEKVAILRRHLIDSVPISDLCSEYDLQPTVFYRWQKQFFENGASALKPTQSAANLQQIAFGKKKLHAPNAAHAIVK